MILLKSRSFTEAAPRWHDDQIVKLDFLDVLLISWQPTAVALDSRGSPIYFSDSDLCVTCLNNLSTLPRSD